MQLREILERAAEEVDGAAIPSEFRGVAFGKAVDILVAGERLPTAPAAAEPSLTPPIVQDGLPPASEDPYARIASKIGIERTRAEQVWFFGDAGNVELLIHKVDLPNSARQAQRLISLLVAAGRQAAGIDDRWTSVSVVREELERYGRLDTKHFAEYFDGVRDVMSIRGRGGDRHLSVLPDGWAAARSEVSALKS